MPPIWIRATISLTKLPMRMAWLATTQRPVLRTEREDGLHVERHEAAQVDDLRLDAVLRAEPFRRRQRVEDRGSPGHDRECRVPSRATRATPIGVRYSPSGTTPFVG